MFHFWISKKPSSRRMWLIFIFSLLLLHLVCSSYNTATLVMFRNSYLLTLSSNLRFRCELVLLHCTLLYCLLPATCSKLTCGSQHFRLHVLHTRLLYVASKLEVRLRLPQPCLTTTVLCILSLKECWGHNANVTILHFSRRDERKEVGRDSRRFEKERSVLAKLRLVQSRGNTVNTA